MKHVVLAVAKDPHVGAKLAGLVALGSVTALSLRHMSKKSYLAGFSAGLDTYAKFLDEVSDLERIK
jgi:hypothetical protein